MAIYFIYIVSVNLAQFIHQEENIWLDNLKISDGLYVIYRNKFSFFLGPLYTCIVNYLLGYKYLNFLHWLNLYPLFIHILL